MRPHRLPSHSREVCVVASSLSIGLWPCYKVSIAHKVPVIRFLPHFSKTNAPCQSPIWLPGRRNPNVQSAGCGCFPVSKSPIHFINVSTLLPKKGCKSMKAVSVAPFLRHPPRGCDHEFFTVKSPTFSFRLIGESFDPVFYALPFKSAPCCNGGRLMLGEVGGIGGFSLSLQHLSGRLS